MEALDEPIHNKMMDLFRKYLLVGGLPDAVNAYLETKNIQRVREIQNEIHDYYAADASKYDTERKLKIRRIYGNNIRAVLNDERSINLGSVYESVAASELTAHGHKLFYYDNRSKGEVDYLIDDYDSLSVIPIEVKSGKDYTIHSALSNFVRNEDYHIKKAFVVSNERTVKTRGKITYLPIYYVMFF